MRGISRAGGSGFLATYGFSRRAWAKLFSLLSSGAFSSFGRNSVIEPPLRIHGAQRIAVGDGVFVGAGSWLQAHARADRRVTIEIGDGTSIVGGCVLSASARVRLGEKVLMARNVYVSDHSHGYEATTRAVLDQGLTGVAAVEIGDGAWLGENVVVCPGVTIGRGAVIGANSVVTSDVPDHSLAVGAPARVVRDFSGARTSDDARP